MHSEIEAAVRSLSTTGAAIRTLASDLSYSEARWKPAPDRWSVLEVVNHLADEEAEDFRARLDILLHRPDTEFAPIDPPGWVTHRAYAERDMADSLDRFDLERARSLAWLAKIQAAALGNTREHPRLGTMSGRQMLASWIAHDLLHVRQIARLRYESLAERVGQTSIEYAGNW
ncbi:MAG: DinB family protein [Gemmatimonadota bacterium]